MNCILKDSSVIFDYFSIGSVVEQRTLVFHAKMSGDRYYNFIKEKKLLKIKTFLIVSKIDEWWGTEVQH